MLAVAFVAWQVPGSNVPEFIHILHHEASVRGVVTSTQCWNHNSVLCSFTFNGKTYACGGFAREQPCESYKPGSPITVYFSTASPATNDTIEPRAGLWNEIIGIALICLIFPPLIIECLRRSKLFQDF